MPVETDSSDAPPVDPADLPVVDVSPVALERVIAIRDDEEDGDTLGLRIEITGSNGPDYTYDLAFESLSDVQEGDDVTEIGGLKVWVPADSIENLRGSVLDVPVAAAQVGLVIRNPNRPSPLAGVDLDLSGTLSEKIQQLLDQSVNPSLASHGGFATLVGVEGSRVFITMGGGCQGCAMSTATLVHGIQAAILDALPGEVTEVVDATDHAAGDNPFY